MSLVGMEPLTSLAQFLLRHNVIDNIEVVSRGITQVSWMGVFLAIQPHSCDLGSDYHSEPERARE